MILYYKLDHTGKFDIEYPVPIDKKDIQHFNDAGWSIVRTVNSFKSMERKEFNIKKLLYWYVDLDGEVEDKQEMLKDVMRSPLFPSLIIESFHGYHIYWKIRDKTMPLDEYKKIQVRLFSHFKKADRLKDATRLLKVAGTKNWKGTGEPFVMKVIEDNNNRTYTLKQMESFFKHYGDNEELPKSQDKNLEESKIPSELDPIDCGEYFRIICPKCGATEINKRAFLYKNNELIVCNRKHNCGFTGTLDEILNLKLDPR